MLFRESGVSYYIMKDQELLQLASIGEGREALNDSEARELHRSPYVNWHYSSAKTIFTLNPVAKSLVAQSRTRLSSLAAFREAL